jgi:predicted DNA binding CopG/RHH family protein
VEDDTVKPKRETKEGEIKTTLRCARSLWTRARHRALEQGMPVQDLVVKAIQQYLGKKGGRS